MKKYLIIFAALNAGFTTTYGMPQINIPTYSIWPMYQHDASHTGYVDLTMNNPEVFHLRWVMKFDERVKKINFPVATNKYLYVSTDSYFDKDSIYAIDVMNGKQKWKVSLDRYFSLSGPSYSEGKIYLQAIDGNEHGTLRAYDAETGAIVYTSPFSAQWDHYLPPTIFKDHIYIDGGTYGGAYSFIQSTGIKLWFTGLPQYDMWTPTVNEQYVIAYCGGNYSPQNGALHVLDRVSGAQLFNIEDNHYEWSGYSVGFSPVLDEKNQLVFGIQSGYLTSYDLLNRNIKYSVGPGFTGQPSLMKGAVFATMNDNLVGINENDGNILWIWADHENSLATSVPIVTDDFIFISDSKSTYAISTNTHKTVWKYPASGKLAINENTLFIVGENTITAIGLI